MELHLADSTINVPQGLTLDPVLFSVFINDLDTGVECILSKSDVDTEWKVFLTAWREEGLDRLFTKFNKGKCHMQHLGQHNASHRHR